MKNKHFRFLLKTKVLTLTVGIVVGALGLYSAFTLSRFRDDKIKYIYYSNMVEIASVSRIITKIIEDSSNILKLLGKSPDAHSRKLPIQEILQTQGAIVALLQESPSKGEIKITMGDPQQKSPDWFQERTLITEALKDLNSALTVKAFQNSILVGTQRSELKKSAVVISTETLKESVKDISMSKLSLVDLKNFQSFALSQGVFKENAAPLPLGPEHPAMKVALKSQVTQGSLDYTNGEVDFVASFHQLSKDFVLVAETEKSTLYSEFQRTVLELLIAAVAILSLGIIVGTFFANSIAGPLAKLSQLVNELGAGRYDAKLSIKSNDEVSDLSAHFMMLGKRLSDREKELEKSTDLANRDGMTGLHNYRNFRERLDQAISLSKRHKRNLSLMLIDVDHFKFVNDTYGHPVGDLVLKTVAQLLITCCRDTDGVFRYGGEEFIVILPETDKAGAFTIAEKVRQTLEATKIPIPEKNGEILSRTASIGVASFIEDNLEGADAFIEMADSRLYKAKKTGRNKIQSS